MPALEEVSLLLCISERRRPFPLCSLFSCFPWRVSAGCKPSHLFEMSFSSSFLKGILLGVELKFHID